LVWDVIDNKRGILSVDAMSDERFAGSETVHKLEIRSVLCAPIMANEKVLGVIHLDGSNPRKPFAKDDMALLVGIAGQAGLAIANARFHSQLVSQELMQQDLALARKIQARFLPTDPPQMPGWEFWDEYEAALEVGGDYYDFVDLPDGRMAVAVGDVSGKGVSGALYMAKLSSDVRYMAASHTEPSEIIRKVNANIARDIEEGMFVTLLFLVLDPRTGDLEVVNAGHGAPLLRSAKGELSTLEVPRNMPLGVMEETRFDNAKFRLNGGDVVIAYTDGVTEAMNEKKEEFGMDRFYQVIISAPGSPGAVGEAVLTAVRNFAGDAPQSDDLTMIAFGPLQDGESVPLDRRRTAHDAPSAM
ncbi:MAG: GAF domain-containing SpoIIE family protein phosphatase, partial [Thermoanaerobaculia bacterium]